MKKSNVRTSKDFAIKDLASVSLLIFLIDKFSSFIYNGLKNGFLGFILTSYSKEQRAFDNSYVKVHFTENILSKRIGRNIQRFLSRSFEGSLLLNKIAGLASAAVTLPLRTLGTSLFSFGIYVVIIYLLRLFLPVVSTLDVSYAIIGVVICIAVIPMLLSKDNIANAVGKSAILGEIFRELFGFREESFRQRTNMSKLMGNMMIIVGMALGILTLVVHPLVILFVIALLIAVSVIFVSPEIGVIAALFILPFLSFFEHSSIVLGLLVLIILSSFIVKLIRGKRILKFEIIDISVLFFGIIILFSGTISAGGHSGLEEVLLTCGLMTGYFLVVNMMRTRRWIKRCIGALVSSGTIVAMIGVFQYASGIVSNKAWLDTEYFFDIKGRVVSLFDNPNVLAIYLIMILPFAMYMMIQASRGRAKLLGLISVISIMLCIIFTWSRGAWLAAILSITLFLLIYSKKTVRYLFLGGLTLPFVAFFLPQSIVRRFASIGDISDSSTLYRVYTWKGSIRIVGDYFFSGIGYGEHAYQAIYPQYAYAGIESAQHSHSLPLQIIIGTGIIGLVAFAIIIFLFAQMNFEHIRDTKDISGKLIVSAALCSIAAALVFGLFDYTWYSYRIFFMFWVVLAIACARVRVGNDEERRHSVDTLSKQFDISEILNQK